MTYNIIIGKKKRVKEPCNYKKSFRGDGLDSTLIEDLGGGGTALLSWPSATLSSSFAALGSVSNFF